MMAIVPVHKGKYFAKGFTSGFAVNTNAFKAISRHEVGHFDDGIDVCYEQRGGYLPAGIKAVLPQLPKSLHTRKGIKRDLEAIRALRNRVFHHERIVHFTDIDAQHSRILSVIGWIRPELHEMALALDRFTTVRREGLNPWLAKLAHHWPHTA